MTVAMMPASKASKEDFAQQEQTCCLPETDWGQAKQVGHEPVPQQHDYPAEESQETYAEQWDKYQVLL